MPVQERLVALAHGEVEHGVGEAAPQLFHQGGGQHDIADEGGLDDEYFHVRT